MYAGTHPFPAIYRCKHSYSDRFQMLTSNASYLLGTQQKLSLNNLNDPDVTGTGHQVYGFDVLSSIYQRYKVYAAKVELLFTDPSGDGMAFCYQVLNPTQVSQSLTNADMNTIRERTNAGYGYINNTGSQFVKRVIYLPMYKACEVTPLQFKADLSNYTAQFDGGPTLNAQIAWAVADLNAGAQKYVYCASRITYYVEWYDRRVQAQS